MRTTRQLRTWLLLTITGSALPVGAALAEERSLGAPAVQVAQGSVLDQAAPPSPEPARPTALDDARPSDLSQATPANLDLAKPTGAPERNGGGTEAQAQPAPGAPAEAQSKVSPAAPPQAADTTPSTQTVPPAATPAATQAATVDDAAALLARIKERAARMQVAAADKDSLAALQTYYGKPNAAPLWIGGGTFNARAKSALKALREADDWGLEAKAFAPPAEPAAAATPDQLADAELLLGIAALKYARFATGGRLDTTKLGKYVDVKPPVADPAAVVALLAGSQDADGVLTGLHPKHPQFVALRAVLLKARAPASAAAPAPVEPVKAPVVKIPDGPLLKVGTKHDQVPLLRQRLSVAPANPDGERLFDVMLSEAVKKFQSGTELKATGMVNNATRHALNGDAPEAKVVDKANPQKDVQRLVLNMERWRWVPAELGSTHVWDNIPEFMTRVVKGGQVIHKEKIIVGKTNTQTPIFSARMQYVVFHPEWGVPDSIKVKEILPYLRRPAQEGFFGFGGGGADTRVLQRHNLRVSMNGRPVDASQVDWNKVDIRQFQFVQPSGGQNVLGVVKFRFPNKHDVYMHDTPQRELFSAKTRTFSHGCMRVHNPQKLAEVILGEDQGMSAGEVANLIARGGGATEITLKKQFPVHVTYMTAVVGDNGNVETFADIYGHDARLQLALSGKQTEFFDPPDVAERPDALARQANIATKRKGPPPAESGPASFLSALFGN